MNYLFNVGCELYELVVSELFRTFGDIEVWHH